MKKKLKFKKHTVFLGISCICLHVTALNYTIFSYYLVKNLKLKIWHTILIHRNLTYQNY